MKNILLTGGAGYIGGHIIEELVKTKARIVIIDNLETGYKKLIIKKDHLILKSGHPSPLSANRGYWFGNKHFSLCNNFLNSIGEKPIKWN